MSNSCTIPSDLHPLSDQDWNSSNTSDIFPESALLVDSQRPAWLDQLKASLDELLQLKPDWDSYGGLRINPGSIKHALKLAYEIFPDDIPPPSVVPTSRGGVQYEWHCGDIDLEVEIISATRVLGFFEDHLEATEWERDLTSNREPLSEALSILKSRQ